MRKAVIEDFLDRFEQNTLPFTETLQSYTMNATVQSFIKVIVKALNQ
jgi:hypothetical protein